MLKRKARLAKFLAIIFITTPFFFGCEDEPATIGLEILPSDDLFEAEMQIEFPEVMNVWTDGIQSNGPTEFSYGLLGYFNDPRFGTTKADFVTEASLISPREAFKENDNFAVDSVILSLSYTRFNWCGDSAVKHHVKIYELNERLSSLNKYYSNKSMEGKYFPELLGEKEWSANDGQTDLTWQASKNVHTVNIFLSEDFGNKLLNLSSTDLNNSNSFKDAFNGFYITLDDPANPDMFNSLLKLDLRAITSNLTFYYHEKLFDVETNEYYGKESFIHTFPINREACMFNRFEHDHTDKIEYDNSASPLLFIQNMSGSYVKLDFSDNLASWKATVDEIEEEGQDTIGISSVELIFEADNKTETGLYMPQLAELYIYEKDDDGNLVIPRYNENTTSAFIAINAVYNNTTNQFVFKMRPDYFKKMVKGEISAKPFYIRGIYPEFNFSRVVLTNKPESDQRPKLHIKYVKYKQVSTSN